METKSNVDVKPNIVAVVVTFNPNIQVLRHQLESLSSQVRHTVIVDNGSRSEHDISVAICDLEAGIEVIELGVNRGIAAAQNVGIEWARRLSVDFVILFDHDSLPAADMIARLLEAHDQMAREGCRVASVGPRYFDARRDVPPPFIRFEGLKLIRCHDRNGDIVKVDFLISSGCLIPMSVLDEVGGMTEELFIDYVDIEWGLRAKHLGYQSYGSFAAKMAHSLGDTPIRFFGMSVPLHSPLRHYYLARNAIWLYRQSWPPTNWKLVDGWRMFLKFGFYSLFAKPRIHHFKMMTLGLWHGLRGRMGELTGFNGSP